MAKKALARDRQCLGVHRCFLSKHLGNGHYAGGSTRRILGILRLLVTIPEFTDRNCARRTNADERERGHDGAPFGLEDIPGKTNLAEHEIRKPAGLRVQSSKTAKASSAGTK